MIKINQLIELTGQDKTQNILNFIRNLGLENEFLEKFFRSTLVQLMEIGDEILIENVSNGDTYMIKKIYKPQEKKRIRN